MKKPDIMTGTTAKDLFPVARLISAQFPDEKIVIILSLESERFDTDYKYEFLNGKIRKLTCANDS